MSTPLRAVRTAQTFAPTAPKFPSVRSLHITGANAQPSSALAFQNKVAELRKTGERPAPKAAARPFNTTRAFSKPNDTSPIDLVYMPSLSSVDSTVSTEYMGLMPILPDNNTSARAQDPILVATEEPILRSEISTSSMATEATVAAMSESDGGKQADSMGMLVESVKDEVSGVKRVWDGFVDDLLGPKKVAV